MIYKVILLGDTGVGKSSYLHMLTEGDMSDDCPMTIGVDFKTFKTEVQQAKVKVKVKVYIWDTAGQETFRAIVSSYYRDAVGALVFFDMSLEKSMQSCDQWICNLLKHRNPQPCRIVLVGHKTDITEKIDSVQIANFVEMLKVKHNINIRYCEVSTKENVGVNEAMNILVQDIYQQWPIQKTKTTVYPVGIRIDHCPKKQCCWIS
jgi:small GTP-binding protein